MMRKIIENAKNRLFLFQVVFKVQHNDPKIMENINYLCFWLYIFFIFYLKNVPHFTHSKLTYQPKKKTKTPIKN